MKIKINENLIDNIGNSASKISKSKLFNFNIKTKTVVLLFVLLIISITCLSAYFVINDDENLLNLTSTQNEEETTSAVAADVTTASSSLDADILFVLTDDTPETINLLLLVSFDTSTYDVSYQFISPQETVVIDSEEKSLQEYFYQYGLTQLISAVSAYTNDDVDRYISLTQSAYSTIVALTSSIQVTIDEDFTYKYNGINYVFSQGTQVLSADMLTKYTLYLSEQDGGAQDELVDIVASFMVEFFDTYSIEQGYEVLINIISTNISAYDIVVNERMLEDFFSSEEEKTVTITSNAAQ